MKKISEEIQAVYNFCEERKKDALDKAVLNVPNFNTSMRLANQSTCYSAVQRFIEANFMENDGE